MLADGIRQGVKDRLGLLPQCGCGARRGGRGKAQQPVPGATEGLQAFGKGCLGETTERLRQASRLSLKALQTPGNLIKTGLQVGLERRHGFPHSCSCGRGRIRERLPLLHGGFEQRLGLCAQQRPQRFMPHLHERYQQRRQGIAVIDVESSIQFRLAGGGENDVEYPGNHVLQFADLNLGPGQPVVSQLSAGFIESQRRPGGAAGDGHGGFDGPSIPIQRINSSADVVPRTGKIRFQSGAPKTARIRLEQLPVGLDLFLGRAEAGANNAELLLDGRNVQDLQEHIPNDLPGFLLDVSLIVPGLELDVLYVRLEARDAGVNVPHRVLAQESARNRNGDSHIGDADAGRGSPADAKTGDARPDENQRRDGEQDGCKDGGILCPQGGVQRWRHSHLVDGLFQLTDRHAGLHDVHGGFEPGLVQGKQQRHQKKRGEEQR